MSNDLRNKLTMSARWMPMLLAIGIVLLLGIAPGIGAEEKPNLDKLVGQPAELSPWAYAYRADLNPQEKPEAAFILRRLERIDRVYRPVSLLLTQGSDKRGTPWPKLETDWQLLSKKDVRERGKMLPAPSGVLTSALLWEGRMRLNRLVLHWPKNRAAAAKRRTSRVSRMVRLVWLAIGSASDRQARSLEGWFDLGL